MTLIRTLADFLRDRKVRRSLWALLKFVVFVVAMVLAFSVGFQVLMARLEGRSFSMLTSIYWTLSTMTTLGYGDIVFESEAGRIYTLAVLMGGIVTIFIVFPFTFIRFFYAPWLEA
ncbi:MAG: potassium channel protein, partial [Bacteroidetes bacterium]